MTLDVTNMSFADGVPVYRYLEAYSCGSFLSADPRDVLEALKPGFVAALVYPAPKELPKPTDQVRIAFAADAVIFGVQSDEVYKQLGLEMYQQREELPEDTSLNPGPFSGFLKPFSLVQPRFPEERTPIRTALVTPRNAPADRRVIETLRDWGVRMVESHFLGGVEKARILRVFNPHIFFDDQR